MKTDILKFLLGEGPLDGVWFGDPHPKYPGMFWWRALLRREMESDQPEGGPTIGELKDMYTIAQHVGIPGTKIDAFVKTAAMAGYIFVRATVDASTPQVER